MMKDWLIIVLIILCAWLLHQINNPPSGRTEAEAEAGMPHYYYTVGYEAIGYIGGVKTETFEDYQEAVGVKPDGKAGYDTCTATNFYNNQRKVGLK